MGDEELTVCEAQVGELKEEELEVKAALEPLPPGLRGEKYEAYVILRAAGVPQTRAARVLGLSKAWSSKIGRSLDKRYDLTNSKFLKLASKAIENILKGQTFGEVESIKGANVVAAAQMVFDRAEPITQKLDISQTIALTDEELDIRQLLIM